MQLEIPNLRNRKTRHVPDMRYPVLRNKGNVKCPNTKEIRNGRSDNDPAIYASCASKEKQNSDLKQPPPALLLAALT